MRAGKYNYRDAECCPFCAHVDMKYFGKIVGYYCALFDTRCGKKKVCDKFVKEGEGISIIKSQKRFESIIRITNSMPEERLMYLCFDATGVEFDKAIEEIQNATH